ncbi:MAG: LacI family DNA-binding transcriptional regulator [Dehalococcoidia bacterium]
MTVLDVAKRAGVSPATVSRVLSEKSVVAPATKERVLRAVSELGYEPNRFAQGLRSGKNNTVAFAIGDIEQYVYLQLSQHMQNALEAIGLDLLLFNLGHRGDRFEAILNRSKALRLSGLILATSDPVDTAAIERFRSDVKFSACPIIVVGQDVTAEGIPSVWHDDDESAFAAATYLLRQGCRKIGYVGRIKGSAVGSWRYQGYRRALLKWGVDVPADRVFDCAFRYPAGYASGEKISARRSDFDAVICGSDEMALGVMAAASDGGIAVPDELSIIGFGDIEWSSFVRPALTTLSTNYRDLAAQAAEIVVAAEDPAGLVLKHKIGRDVVIRGSTV